MNYIKNIYIFFIYLLIFHSTIEKLIDFNNFTLSVIKTDILASNYSLLLSYLVVILEIITLISIFINEKVFLLFTTLLFLIFSNYIILLRLFDKYSSCGCGGFINTLGFNLHLTLNLTIFIISYFFYHKLSKKQI